VRRFDTFARIALVASIGLLALPLAQTASPVEGKKRPRTITRTFRNLAAIEFPYSTEEDPMPAELYPSTIAVGGLKGTIRDVNVTLHGFSFYTPKDADVLLVGPGGQTAIVMARVGKPGTSSEGLTLRLDDEAATPLAADTQLQSGAYRPANLGGAVDFLLPAPEAGANASLSVFDGSNPNGVWRLFVMDEYVVIDAEAIEGGWEVEITTKVRAKKKNKR
jgi:hypothetical protein